MNKEGYTDLIIKKHDEGNLQQTLILINDAIQKYPEESNFYFFLGNITYQIDKFEESLNAYNKALELDPDNIEIYVERAKSKYESSQYKSALKDYKIADDNGWEFKDYDYYVMGECKAHMNLHKQAILYFKKALEIEPEQDMYNCVTGYSYLMINEYNNALKYLLEAVRLNPTNAFYCFVTCKIYMELKQYDNAILYCRKAIILEPNISYYENLADIYILLNDYENIIKYCEKVIELGNDSYFYNFSIGRALYKSGKSHDALHYANKSIKLNPKFAGGYSIICCIYNKLKMYERALIFNNKAINLCPEEPILYANKIEILTALNRTEEIPEVEKKLEKLEVSAKVLKPEFGNKNVYSVKDTDDNKIIEFKK